jgi:electron transfer flavoprotein alpha subunit
MAQGILVFIEERDGKVKKTSLEALAAARKLADTMQESVSALYIGSGDPSVDLASFGADKVLRVQHELLAGYSTEGYCAALAQAAQQVDPRIILGSASSMGRDLLPRVAARLRVGLAQDCVEIYVNDQKQLECIRPIYAGKAYARVRLLLSPAIATLRPNVFSAGNPDSARKAEVVDFQPQIKPEQIRASVKSVQDGSITSIRSGRQEKLFRLLFMWRAASAEPYST